MNVNTEEPQGAGTILANGTEMKTDKAATCIWRSSSAILAPDYGASTLCAFVLLHCVCVCLTDLTCNYRDPQTRERAAIKGTMERTKLMSKEVGEHRGDRAALPINHVFVC